MTCLEIKERFDFCPDFYFLTDMTDLIVPSSSAEMLQSLTFTFTLSALNLEKEYSREKAVEDRSRMLEPEEQEEIGKGGEEVSEDGEERSGWDFFKSVIRTNLGPEVIEPNLPAEPATKKSRPKVMVGKKKTNQGQGLGDVSQASNGKTDFDRTGENSDKLRQEEEMETTTLPPCSELLPIDIERGFKCFNDTEVWQRY